MPVSLSATPVNSRSLDAVVNPVTAKDGFWPGDYPGASAYPGVVWAYGVLDATPIVSLAGLYPPFYP